MAGEGSMQHMRNVLKANKALLDKRINIFDRGSRFSRIRIEYTKATKADFNYKKASKEELIAIRERILKQRKKDRLKAILILILFLPIMTLGFYWVVHSIKANNKWVLEQTAKIETENLIKRKKYADCIADGDLWLKRNRWHNAIFQYKIARDLFPNDQGVKNRLAIAYTYRCRDENKNCSEAKQSIDELLRMQPDNLELHELLASYYFGIGDSLKATLVLNNVVE